MLTDTKCFDHQLPVIVPCFLRKIKPHSHAYTESLLRSFFFLRCFCPNSVVIPVPVGWDGFIHTSHNSPVVLDVVPTCRGLVPLWLPDVLFIEDALLFLLSLALQLSLNLYCLQFVVILLFLLILLFS